jgi:hypothetical protein
MLASADTGRRCSPVRRRHRRCAATWISWVALGSGVSAVVQISKTATLCHFALTLVEFGVGAGARVIDGLAEAGGLHAGQSRPRFEQLACCARVALSQVHVREPGVHGRPSVISLMKVVKVAKLADTECISTQLEHRPRGWWRRTCYQDAPIEFFGPNGRARGSGARRPMALNLWTSRVDRIAPSI